MNFKPYEKLAEVYDGLMKNVDYFNWSSYILDIAETRIKSDASVLELAAGNCKMADLISRKYNNYICTDISYSMLNYYSRNGLSKVCCDMSFLPFKKKFDFIFSAFDSINYILKKKNLIRLFSEVYSVLSDKGVFTFDVSLESNSLKFIEVKTSEDFYNGFLFIRKSQYKERNRIHYNNFRISHGSGFKAKEVHKQKIYDLDTYFKLSEDAGFYTEYCYSCFTFNDANPSTERAQFVMRKGS
ncbi:MAG: methyltransferase domain-containing protein [Ignavibacteriaceae bacterium]